MAERQYVFEMKYVLARDDPYFHVRWDRATIAEVVAPSRGEAFTALWALLGPSRDHMHWTAEVVSIRDLRVVEEVRRDR